ncbi:MAG: glutamate--tRNA ligase, partial [Alphaproteobacteria bacterium]|nr:glutamate--tRNA ligase [Alphaproteobacteria bacterium]
CWLFAQRHHGWFLLRIDDTDLERSKDELTEAIKRDLTWLGIKWDDYAHQKHRMERYTQVIEQLKADGRLYACYETPEELELKRKVMLGRKMAPVYDRASLTLTAEQKAKYEAEGRKPHWRFKLEHRAIVWNDLIRGEVKFDGALMSDPVLIREDGTPLYHLCSVIDDIDFKITHVVRGEDHVSNTASHIQMFEAIGGGKVIPHFAHLPLISDAEGGKLSKRLGSLSLQDLRDVEGFEPQTVISLMGRLGTSDPIEPFYDVLEIAKTFDFDKFSRGTPKFDSEELVRLNAKIIHVTPFHAVRDRLKAMVGTDVDESFWEAVRPNIERLKDFKDWWTVAKGPVSVVVAPEDKEFIEKVASLLPAGEFSKETWGQWLSAIKGNTDRKGKMLFMPIRKALTGMEHGPELDALLPLIGRERALERLKAA